MGFSIGSFPPPVPHIRPFFILVLIAAGALGYLGYLITSSILSSKSNDDLRDVAFATNESTVATTISETSETNETIPEETEPEILYVSPIDFASLQDINWQIYSWIEIPDTPISYPVLQNPYDFNYYLNHTFDDQVNPDGSIFSEGVNSLDYSDAVTILYGHNLRNREMFGSLREYRNESYMSEHRIITIYTPEAELHYTVFASVTYTNELLTEAFDLGTDEGVQEFLDSIYDTRSMGNIFMDEDVIVTTDSHILVLSTCNGNPAQRFLVLAVLEEEE